MKIRVFWARKMGCAIGQAVNIESGAEFDEHVTIGDRSSLGVILKYLAQSLLAAM